MKDIFDAVKHKVRAFFAKREIKEKRYLQIPEETPETTEEKILYLRQLKQMSLLGGGEERQRIQHEKGKYLARERIEREHNRHLEGLEATEKFVAIEQMQQIVEIIILSELSVDDEKLKLVGRALKTAYNRGKKFPQTWRQMRTQTQN